MAKRPVNRSQADDSPTAAPLRARRARAAAPAPASTETAVGQARPVELDPEPPSTPRQALSPWQPSEEEIRQRAYQRFLQRGGAHGRAFDDWIEAERELKLRG
jgi:hypothetical protein